MSGVNTSTQYTGLTLGEIISQVNAGAATQAAVSDLPVASAGVIPILSANDTPRVVQIVVSVTQEFADGDGAAPEFIIGTASDPDAYVADVEGEVGGNAGESKAVGGLLAADDSVIVTATAGTGTATGAIRVSVIAAPNNA